MGDGNVSVAHSTSAQVNVGTVLELRVRVRDLTGRPLSDATVNFISLAKFVKTDNEGLAVQGGVTGLTSIFVSASYTPQFGAGAGAPLTTPPREVPISQAYDATPKDAAPGTGPFELYATILVPVYYPLKALFSWQNPILRKKIYMAAVSVGQFLHKGDVDHPEFNRVVRLREIIQRADPNSAVLADAQTKLKSKVDENVKDIKKLQSGIAKVQADTLQNDSKPSAAAQKKLDNDKATLETTKTQLEDSNKQVAAAQDVLNAALASHGGTTHRQLMEYLIDTVFPKTDYDPWIKYGIVHLTGLRYRPSAGCCHPPDDFVRRMRQKEIDELEHSSSSSMSADDYAKKQRGYAREYLTLLKNDSALSANTQSFLPGQFNRVLGNYGKGEKVVPHLEKLAKSDGPWLLAVVDPAAPKSKTPPPKPKDLYDMRVIASAVSLAWSKGVGAVPKGSAKPRDENEFLGEILDRFWKKQIPEAVWKRAVMCTQLLHDFMDDSWDTTPRYWNQPDVPKEWNRIFPQGEQGEFDWLTHHEETQQPFITGVVCNDTASTLARSRGIALGGAASIEGIVARVVAAGEALAKKLETDKLKNAKVEADDPNYPEPKDAPAPPPVAVAKPTPSGPGFAGLYRPTDISDIKRGDFMFFAHWTDAASESWEVHTVVPSYILDLTPPDKAFKEDDNFGRAIREGIKQIKTLEELVIPDHEVGYAVQIDRGGKLGNRIVRGWYRYPKEVKKPAAKDAAKTPEPPPDPDKPAPPVQRTAVYEACTFIHIATVIDVLKSDKAVINIETADPVGFVPRGWNQLSNPAYFLGRIPDSTPPDLSWFLNRDNLLAKGRLDDG